MPLTNLKIISAGAGSGKTYRLTQEMTALLTGGEARPSGIIATTFTKRAAAELRERVRVSLLREGMTAEANELKNALIGTVHGLGVKLLRRFAFEAGVSPSVDIIAEEDQQRIFNLSMASVIGVDTIDEIERLCVALGLSKDGEPYNWRRDVRQLVEVVRSNNFGAADIAKSKQRSWEELVRYLPPLRKDRTYEQFRARALVVLSETAAALDANENDGTKKTATAAANLRKLHGQLRRRGFAPWREYAVLADFEGKVGAKSRELVADVVALGEDHVVLPAFQDDLRRYQDLLFDCARDAIGEYDNYKRSRGRIDYTDMEVLVLRLLDDQSVRDTLSRELDLLMVDEFQDTSPIQLALFLKLSRLATRSVWVGDPKQSIYGFRGAEPRLMKAVMDANGPLDPANIQPNSWRSRADVVYACNAIFTKAFPDIDPAAVALEPVRLRAGNNQYNLPAESPQLAERSAVEHWHFELEGGGRFAKSWLREATARGVAELLDNPPPCRPKDEAAERPLRPGDVAILCRSNYNCAEMAKALAKQGIPAAIARTGLLDTAEATLILACLKYMLNRGDSLSVAEILLFGQRHGLPQIIEDRLDWLEKNRMADGKIDPKAKPWGNRHHLVKALDELRAATHEHSAAELLNLLLERLDLRRIIVAWGEGEQRLSNIDELRRLAVAYEENCHRQHRAASLGGYLLYLDGLLRAKDDKQGAGERPEAVNVLTYHRSKGLEWPLVIVADLDQDLRAGVWGLSVQAEREEVDLDDPLAGRWLKYWVNPYDRSGGKVGWVNALTESDWHERATEDALAEEARLLYVGFTRARDYLVLPTGKTGAPWLDRAYARGGGVVPVLDPNSADAPFDWRGHEVTKRLVVRPLPRNMPAAEVSSSPVPFIAGERPGRSAHAPSVVTDDWLLGRYPTSGFTERKVYRTPAPPDPATDYKLLSQAIGCFQWGDVPHLEDTLRRERALGLLQNYLPGTEEPVELLLEQSTAFSDWLSDLRARPLARNLRVTHTLADRDLSAGVDWLLRLGDDSLAAVINLHAIGKQFDQQYPLAAATVLAAAEALGEQHAETVAAYVHLPGEGVILTV